MKRLCLALLVWLLFAIPASADPPIYLPIVNRFNPCEVDSVGNWKVIVPAPSPVTNKVKNPSGEIDDFYAAETGTTVTRVTTFQHYGLYSYRVQSNADNEGVVFDLETLDSVDYYVTMRVRGTLPAAWDWALDSGGPFTAPTLLEEIDGDWTLYGLSFSGFGGSTELFVHQNGAGSGDFYIDGIQVEEVADGTYTTYCDGTQEGCEWNGTPHGSSSSRSAESRAGGIVYDLEGDYGLKITGMSGTGTAPQELFVDSYSQLPGGELNNIKTNSRVFTLTGLISEPTEEEFYEVKQTLESLFDPEAYPEDENGYQPIRLRFTGATVHKEIAVHYEGGLEANITADDPCAWEKVAIRFLADDPYWYEYGESAALLDTEDSATFRVVAARLRGTGQWSNLGPPNASGTYATVYALAEDNQYIYIGGDFQNFDNIANADRIVRYNKQAGTYSALGTGANADIQCLALGPDGRLYAGGNFTTIGGVAAARVAVWDGSVWDNLDTGFASTVFSLVFSPDGLLYATTSGAGADDIAYWDGATWTGIAGTGANAAVNDLAFGRNGLLYAVGDFTTINSVTVNRVATWDGSTWDDLNGGTDGPVMSIAIDSGGLVYIGGSFGTAGGVSAATIAVWNGASFTPLGTGTNDIVYSIAIGADGILYAGGNFDTAGGVNLSDRAAKWNGYTWSHLDIDLPGTPIVYAILASKYADPVIPQKYSLYLGFDTSGTGLYAGLDTLTNDGTAPAYPLIVFSRSGGDSAIIETLKNERTGKELLFNYSLLDGETLTIDLAPTKKSISSNFFGSRQDAVLANSDFGDWSLLKGANDVSSFVANDGATVTAFLLWKGRYKSQN